MPKENTTAVYFAFFDTLNADIAARRQAEAPEDERTMVPFAEDRERIEREAARRKRAKGPLRARPKKIHHVDLFG